MNSADVTQQCLDDVLAGRKTPAECAAAYPQIEGLAADLRAALALRDLQPLSLSPAASQRLEARLRQRARAPLPVIVPTRRPAQPAWAMRWALGPALAAALLLGGMGTAAAAGASNPGDWLYRVKRADETVQVWVSPPAARAEVYASLARHRLDELNVVRERGALDTTTLNNLGTDLTSETAAALAAVAQAPQTRQSDILNDLAQLTDEQQTVLVAVAQTAPAAAQAGLRQALEASSEGHTRALALQQQLTVDQPTAASPTPSATLTASPTPSTTHTASPTPTASDIAEPTATSTPTVLGTAVPTVAVPGETHVPPGETHVPPGQTHVPPGQTHMPPGQTHVPPGQTHVPPGQTHVPPGQTHVPPGQTKVPPGQTKIPPGKDKTPRPTQHSK